MIDLGTSNHPGGFQKLHETSSTYELLPLDPSPIGGCQMSLCHVATRVYFDSYIASESKIDASIASIAVEHASDFRSTLDTTSLSLNTIPPPARPNSTSITPVAIAAIH
ncbi:hypothetical protein FRC03_004335 [Tulasnella sp. 419]|nr:hypothetical protein FRC03_004335 [Tulasnella sp. 419]